MADRSTVPLTICAGGAELPAAIAPLMAARPGALLVAPEHLVEPVVTQLAALNPGGAALAGLRLEAVEPDVGERSAGCPCCRDRLDVITAVLAQVRRRRRPSHVFVAVPSDDGSAGHAADETANQSVTTVAHTVLSDPDLRRYVRLDAVVTTLDAVTTVTRLRTGQQIGGPVELEGLAVADRLLVGRADRIADDAFVQLVRTLRSLNRIAPVLAPAVATVRSSNLLDLDAWHGAPTVAPLPVLPVMPPDASGAERTRLDTFGDDGDGPRCVVLEQRGALDAGGVDDWLDAVIREHGPRLHRLQGALAVEGHEHRVCCHGVGSYAMSHPESQHRPDRRSGSSVVVLIGERLPADQLADDLARTVVG